MSTDRTPRPDRSDRPELLRRSSDEVLEERYLARISALLDGELEDDQLLPTLDFLVNTPDARHFYRRARALDGVLDGAGERSPRERPGLELWQRIVRDVAEPRTEAESPVPVGAERPSEDHGLRRQAWWAAAAAIVLTVLAWIGLRQEGFDDRAARPVDRTLSELGEVTVGGRPDAMTDERFLQLATELVEADERYRREMLELMSAVEEMPLAEATTEESRYGESPADYREGPWRGEEPFDNGRRVEVW